MKNSSTGWQLVYEKALTKIHRREWKPGDQIPNEEELAKQFGFGRATVNRGLQALAHAGFIERRRKAGTRVAIAPERKAKTSLPMIRRAIESKGGHYNYEILAKEIKPLPEKICIALGLPKNIDGYHIITLYLSSGKPYCLEDRWLNMAADPRIKSLEFKNLSPNEWLIKNISFNHGKLDFVAGLAEGMVAKWLDCLSGAPILVVDRVTNGPRHAVTWVRISYAPGHSVHMDI